jgi:hypothetical protein
LRIYPALVPLTCAVVFAPCSVSSLADLPFSAAQQNKTLSDNPEPGLALQGIGYLTRKAIGLTTVTLHIKQYEKDGLVHIDIDQTATGGIKGTSEIRTIDGESREHTDWLFGTVAAKSEWAGGAKHPAIADFEAVKEHDVEWLTKDWLQGPEEATGPDGAINLVNSVRAVPDSWTASQVWGFETIGGERRYTRHVVLKKGAEKVKLRLVYDFISDEP